MNAPSTYLADKLAALRAGRPWPPPLKNDPPMREHEWDQVSSRTLGGEAVWHCRRCGVAVLDHQKPPAGRCRRGTRRGKK